MSNIKYQQKGVAMSGHLKESLSKLSNYDLLDRYYNSPDTYSEEAMGVMGEIINKRKLSKEDLTSLRIQKISESIEQKYQESEEKKLKGLGGWLIVFGIFFFLGTVSNMIDLFTGYDSMDNFTILISCILAGMHIIILVFFGMEHQLFPIITTIFLIAFGFLSAVGYFMMGSPEVAIVTVAVIIPWVFYLNNSERVKLTFVEK